MDKWTEERESATLGALVKHQCKYCDYQDVMTASGLARMDQHLYLIHHVIREIGPRPPG